MYDRTPVMPIPSDEVSFDCLVKDYLGPLMPTHTVEFNCALVLYDINTSYPLAFLFRSLSAKKKYVQCIFAAVSDHRYPICYSIRLRVKFHEQFDHHVPEIVAMHT